MFHFNRVLLLSVFAMITTQSLQSPVDPIQQVENLDIDISCVSNATCVKSISSKVFRALYLKKAIDFGAFAIEPKENVKKVEGRSFSKLGELVNNNAIRVPIGSYSLSLQKSEEYENYFELAVSKTVEGKEKLLFKQSRFQLEKDKPEEIKRDPFYGLGISQSSWNIGLKIDILK